MPDPETTCPLCNVIKLLANVLLKVHAFYFSAARASAELLAATGPARGNAHSASAWPYKRLCTSSVQWLLSLATRRVVFVLLCFALAYT